VWAWTIIVKPPRFFPQTLPQLLDLDHKLVEFPLRRRQRPVRPRHQKGLPAFGCEVSSPVSNKDRFVFAIPASL